MDRDLAIVNTSGSVVATMRFRLSPGQKIRLTDYYRTEQAARGDLVLAKFINAGFVTIVPVDWDGIARLPETIARLDERDRLAQRESVAERRRRRQQRRAELATGRNLAREQHVREHAELTRQVEQQRDYDLKALFEQNRKARLARAIQKGRQHEAEKLRRETPPVPVLVESIEPTVPIMLAPEPEPLVQEVPVVEEPVQEVPVVEEPVILTESYEESHETVEEPVDAVEQMAQRADETPADRSVDPDVEDLEEPVLRFILEEFSVQGRKKIKSRRSLVRAVQNLELAPEDLRKLVEDYGRQA